VVKDEVAAKKAREAVAALVREFFFLCWLYCLNYFSFRSKCTKTGSTVERSYFESIDSFDVDVDFLKYTSPLTISQCLVFSRCFLGVFSVFSRC
jgi:hypothetical protein